MPLAGHNLDPFTHNQASINLGGLRFGGVRWKVSAESGVGGVRGARCERMHLEQIFLGFGSSHPKSVCATSLKE